MPLVCHALPHFQVLVETLNQELLSILCSSVNTQPKPHPSGVWVSFHIILYYNTFQTISQGYLQIKYDSKYKEKQQLKMYINISTLFRIFVYFFKHRLYNFACIYRILVFLLEWLKFYYIHVIIFMYINYKYM